MPPGFFSPSCKLGRNEKVSHIRPKEQLKMYNYWEAVKSYTLHSWRFGIFPCAEMNLAFKSCICLQQSCPVFKKHFNNSKRKYFIEIFPGFPKSPLLEKKLRKKPGIKSVVPPPDVSISPQSFTLLIYLAKVCSSLSIDCSMFVLSVRLGVILASWGEMPYSLPVFCI